jgi:hypothetical protein
MSAAIALIRAHESTTTTFENPRFNEIEMPLQAIQSVFAGLESVGLSCTLEISPAGASILPK